MTNTPTGPGPDESPQTPPSRPAMDETQPLPNPLATSPSAQASQQTLTREQIFGHAPIDEDEDEYMESRLPLILASVALLLGLISLLWIAGIVPSPKVPGSQIKDSSVTGQQVKDGSLEKGDFGGSLPTGPAGPAGPEGPAGPAGKAGKDGLSAVTTVSATLSSKSITEKSKTVSCAKGSTVLSGGATLSGDSSVVLRSSAPTNDRKGWTASASAGTVKTVGSWRLEVFAICADFSSKDAPAKQEKPSDKATDKATGDSSAKTPEAKADGDATPAATP